MRNWATPQSERLWCCWSKRRSRRSSVGGPRKTSKCSRNLDARAPPAHLPKVGVGDRLRPPVRFLSAAIDREVRSLKVERHNAKEKSMLRKYVPFPLLGIFFVGTAAFASPVCTKEPEHKWLSEAAMQQKIAEMGYKNIKVLKKTTTGCYEIYGYTADNRKAEVYFNPITGEPVEKNVD
jgi:hypothetical protein